MPEHIRALIVILLLATAVFAFAEIPATAIAMDRRDFVRRRNLWFAITLIAFLAHNFWIYIVVTAALLLFVVSREPNPLAMYFFVLFAVPTFSAEISGLGLIRFFFSIGYLRLLALTVLLPTYLLLRAQPGTERFGRLLPDKLIIGYLGLNLMLQIQVDTFTNALRVGAFYAFTDVFLPYYVASRSLKNLRQFRGALMGFVLAALILSAVGAFEYARHWLLYGSLESALGVKWGYGIYLSRAEDLRAVASTGQPIPLGYVMAIAIGFCFYLRRSVSNQMLWGLGLLLLTAGLMAPLSRGPWVGAAAMLVVFVVLGPAPGRRLAILGAIGAIAVPILLVTPIGEKLVSMLPFVGSVDEGNVTYRQRLLEIGIQVILQRPLFGAFDFMYSPAIQALRQGEGIIDIVNTYLGVALSGGLVALFLFVGFFVAVGIGIFKSLRKVSDIASEVHLLGETLLSTLVGILVIISTVSSITVIPVVYWSVAGIGVAYARMLATPQSTSVATGILQ